MAPNDEQVIEDTITLWPALAYHGTFSPEDRQVEPEGHLPPGRHGLYFRRDVPVSTLRPDGTPADDGVVPEVGLPRRMFAAEQITFHRPIRFGEHLQQRTNLHGLTEKRGRSGPMVFARITQTIEDRGVPAISIVQDDVFLESAKPAGSPARAPDDWPDSAEYLLGSVELFRFSALTFNAHRIHLDRAWARDVEGHPGLLVHGPLQRMLLIDAAVRWYPGPALRTFSVRMSAPLYADAPFHILGRPRDDGADLVVAGPDCTVRATAALTWAR